MVDVILAINGVEHRGWKRVRLLYSMDALATSFELDFAEQWLESGEPVPIQEEDEADIYVDEQLVLSGYVESLGEQYDDKNHELSCSGYSKTIDLGECSAIYQGGQIRGKTIRQIAETLCAPFGISVSVDPSNLDLGDKIDRFKLEPGETPFDSLQRLTRKRGVYMSTDFDGNLVLGRAGETFLGGVTLRRGENVKSGRYRGSRRDRFSSYIFKSQIVGDDNNNGEASAHVVKVIEDYGVSRYRPLQILAEHQSDRKSLDTRAKWERNVRAGRSEEITYTVVGWHNIHGLWQPNTIVGVDDDRFRIDADMLIKSVELTLDVRGGTIATLELTGRESYDVFAPPERKRKGRA